MKTKSNYFYVLASLLMLVPSCNKSETENLVPSPEIAQNLVPMTFTATMEGSATKTTLGDDWSVSWAEGDAVKFVWELDKTPGSSISDALGSDDVTSGGGASFTASVPADFAMTEEDYKATGGSSLHLYAVYPSTIETDYSNASSFYATVPTEQDGTFASASIALAKWDKTAPTAALEFKNLCGLLQVKIADENVTKFVIHSDDYIAGKMDISFTGPAVKNVKTGSNEITVNVSGAGTYYVAVLPTNETKGIGVTNLYVSLYNGSELIGDKVTSNELIVSRSQIRKLGTIATGFSDRLYVTPTGTGDGTSWANPAGVTELLAVMQSTTTVTKNVYMAAGDYSIKDKDAKAPAGSNIKLYGGFPSSGWSSDYSLASRNISSNETTIKNTSGRTFYTRNGNWHFDGITFTSTGYSSSAESAFGCALILIGGNITVNKCTFKDSNHAGTGNPSGGAVRVNTTALFKDCVFSNNNSSGTNGKGGAICVTGSGNLTLDGCTFTDNTAKTTGGAIYVASGGNVTATDCTFGESGHPNSSTTQGGAIYLNGGTINLDSCTFSNNEATTNGGAIQTNNGTLTAYNCNFVENKSTKTGGTIQAANATTIRLNQCVFIDNQSVGTDKATSNTSLFYIGGTSSIFLNGCYMGQSSASFEPGIGQNEGTYYSFLILTGANAQAGFNNCVISGPFAPSTGGRLIHFGGNTVVVNTTIYSQVSFASIYRSAGAGSDACRIINSIVLNNSSNKYSFTVPSGYVMQAYSSIYSSNNGAGTFTPTNCLSGKYNAATLDSNAFPDNNPWAQKSLGTAAALPEGGSIKVYAWDGVCDGFTKTTLSDIKTLISGTTDVGSSFLSWLESEDLKVNGVEALATDIRGYARNTSAMWPGSYEVYSAGASAPSFNVR